MSKAILVMDMPENCFKCKLQDWANCRIAKRCHTGDTRPEWCPLKTMPEKIGIEEALKMPRNGCIGDVINTYNACIDEILGD